MPKNQGVFRILSSSFQSYWLGDTNSAGGKDLYKINFGLLTSISNAFIYAF